MNTLLPIEHRGPPATSSRTRDGWRLVEGNIFGDWKAGATIPPNGQRVLAPIEPSKIVAIGRNYKDHAAELGNPLPVEPMIFLKPPSAIIGPSEPIVIPTASAASTTRRSSAWSSGRRRDTFVRRRRSGMCSA